MPAQKSDRRAKRRAGFYWESVNGVEEPFVSVTTVLKVLDKPALLHWMAKEVWMAMSKEPSLSLEEARRAPYKKSKKSMDRGSQVHAIAEAWKKGNLQVNLEGLPENVRPYAQALDSWGRTVKPVPIENEKTVVSYKYGYAGTMDMLAQIGGELAIVDFKTNQKGQVYDEAHLQISAYKQALSEAGIEVEKGYVIGLGENGKFNMVEVDWNLQAFLACKLIWEFKDRKGIEKMGYKRLLTNKEA